MNTRNEEPFRVYSMQPLNRYILWDGRPARP
jgi:hypothetical protein